MRGTALLCLVLLTLGCQSLEDRACENSVRINAEIGTASAGKSTQQQQRNCIDSLTRLRQQLQPDEEAWFTYLRCLRTAPDMGAQSECLVGLQAPPIGEGVAKP